jgi:hypothetical protein
MLLINQQKSDNKQIIIIKLNEITQIRIHNKQLFPENVVLFLLHTFELLLARANCLRASSARWPLSTALTSGFSRGLSVRLGVDGYT